MTSYPFSDCLPQPHHTRTYKGEQMSHTFGAHTQYKSGEHPWIYYKGNRRVVIPNESKAVEMFPPPAWLVADWMIAKSKGQPISERAEKYCNQPTKNAGLLWLKDFLEQSKK